MWETHGRESRDSNTYIRTERVRIFFIISIMLSEFSYGKAQILNRFCSKPFSKGCFHARCSFPHNLEQRQNVFCSRLCRKLQALTQNFSIFVCCLQGQGICTSPHENPLGIKESMNSFLTLLSEYRFKMTRICHVILRLETVYSPVRRLSRTTLFACSIFFCFSASNVR